MQDRLILVQTHRGVERDRPTGACDKENRAGVIDAVMGANSAVMINEIGGCLPVIAHSHAVTFAWTDVRPCRIARLARQRAVRAKIAQREF